MMQRNSTEEDELFVEKEFDFGQMYLRGFRGIVGKSIKFVRAKKDLVNLNDKLYKLMTTVWNIKPPQLIISMNGAAKKMIPLNIDQKWAFKRGLIEVSKAAPTWIITGGFQQGITQLVGEAAKDYSILSKEQTFSVIGIGTWGSVYNKETLEFPENKEKITYSKVESRNIGSGQSLLDPNHHSFILYDDGSEKKFGAEIEFRSEFESFVSDKANCCVVQVIVEGGKNTIITGAKALELDTPVVVMKGSRRAADVICDVIEASAEMVHDIKKLKIEEYRNEWNIKNRDEEEQFDNYLQTFYDSYKKKKVYIFNMRDFKNNLDTAILEAAFSAINDDEVNESKDDKKLKLAMTFNRADVAEKGIFENQTKLQTAKYVIAALNKNQWQFVDLFLRQGLVVESFLTRNTLIDLYFSNDPIKQRHTAIVFPTQDYVKSMENPLEFIGNIINHSTGYLFPKMYLKNNTKSWCPCLKTVKVESSQESSQTSSDDSIVQDYKKYIEPTVVDKTQKCCCFQENDDGRKQYMYTRHPVRNKSGHIIYTEQDLFLWALLTQRIEMAKIFWKNGKDHIGSALIGSIICNYLQKLAARKGEIDMMNSLQQYQLDFENLCINILSEAYKRDQIRTHLLLIRALPYWGRESCLDIANKRQVINFLFHSACQTRLNVIWLGGIPHHQNIIKMIIDIPFFLIVSRIILFSKKISRNKSEYSEPNNTDSKILLVEDNNAEIYDSKSEKTKSMNTDLEKYNEKKQISESKRKLKTDESKKMEFLTKFRQQQISIDKLGYCQALKYFYRAPITKFMMNIASYLTFLTCFSYFTVIELNTLSKSFQTSQRQIEYVVYVFYLSFIAGGLRQFFMGGQMNNFGSKWNNWRSSMWNRFDVLTYLIFAIAFVLRQTVEDQDFIYCRTMFAFSLSLFFIRFMEFYYVQKSIGPKVIMISRMIKDIGFFLAIYLISLLAYGTFSVSLLYSNLSLNSTFLKNIIYNPYWQLFGQINLDYMEGKYTSDGAPNPTANATVIIANAIFLLFANVLLLSLLIAMFGVTFTKVEENSNRVWAYTRYRMIEEFYYRPILPPPFNIFEIIYHGFEVICKKTNIGKPSIDDFIVNLTYEEDVECSGFEQQCMETYLISHPLFIDPSTQEYIRPNNSKTVSSSSSGQPIQGSLENRISTLITSVNELHKEMKFLTEKMHKIRRYQKKSVRPRKSNENIN